MLDTKNNGPGAFRENIHWFVYFDGRPITALPASLKQEYFAHKLSSCDTLGLTNDGWKRRESLSSLCARLVYLAEQNWLPDSKNHPICFCQCRSETLFAFRTISGNLESGTFFKMPFFFSLSFQQISQFVFKFRENVLFFLSNCVSGFFFFSK